MLIHKVKNNYLLFPLHPNTFRQLFQHSTQPQLDQLKTLFSEFHKLNVLVLGSIVWLYTDIVYLGGIAHVILVHLAYLLTSILGFNLIRTYYTWWVLLNLVGFIAKIKVFLLKTSIYLYDLMEILILHFCVMINVIFIRIKAKLLFYLILLQKQIFIDYMNLNVDLLSMKVMLLKLQSEVARYIEILEKVRILLDTLETLLSHIRILKTGVSIIYSFNKIITKILCKFKSICPSSDKINGIVCCFQQEQSNESTNGNNTLKKLILTIPKTIGCSVSERILKFDHSLITKFNKYKNFISKLSKTMELADLVLSTEIMSILGQLYIVETINLVKLNLLISKIKLLHLIITGRVYLLVCTIEFHKEIADKMSELFELMKFECNKFIL